jgi:hypothetical protein
VALYPEQRFLGVRVVGYAASLHFVAPLSFILNSALSLLL